MNESKLIYITADGLYSDIDIYACSIAYAELLRLKGKNAIAIVNTIFTESIPQFLLDLEVSFLNQSNIDWKRADSIIILDRSDSDGLQRNIDLSKVIELFDHHFGYENFWSERLGKNAHIEKVGSCATLIWEQIKKSDMQKAISANSLILLYSAIISNTLNFKAGVTTERDIKASEEIKNTANISTDFIEEYFQTVSENTLKSPYDSMLKDVKLVVINGRQIAIGQLEIWDTSEVEKVLLNEIGDYLPKYEGIPWFVTIASIKEGRNVLISRSDIMKESLSKALGIKWNKGNSIKIDNLLLRKEIIKALQSTSS